MRISQISLAASLVGVLGLGLVAAAQQKPAASSATSIVVYKSPT